jgi:hypothetical protein
MYHLTANGGGKYSSPFLLTVQYGHEYGLNLRFVDLLQLKRLFQWQQKFFCIKMDNIASAFNHLN